MTFHGRAAAAGILATALAAVPALVAHAEEIPAPIDEAGIAAVVNSMSVDELIGQMTWTHVYGNSAHDTSLKASNQERYGVDTPAQVVEKYDLGGVLYFAWSNPVITNNPGGAAALSNGLQEASVADGSGIPLAVTIDQEGGIVARMGPPVTVFPGNMALGATDSTELAYQQGAILGEELAAVGVNVDFAPVVDTNTNPDNPVIGIRSLGEDPARVGALGVELIRGLQDNGVAGAAKHFPGHGDTAVDSHTGLPIVTYDRATLDQHLAPFQDAIDAGVDMIMTAHVIVEVIDDEMPGTLSHNVLTGLLRDELGFDGLVTTDALDMAALKQLPDNPLDDGQIAVLTIQAGSDILLNSPDVDASFAAVRAAVDAGDLTRERLEESVTRILEWKLERGVWADPMVDPAAVNSLIGTEENVAVAREIAEKAITLVRNDDDVLPLVPGEDSVLMVGVGQAWPERMGPLMMEAGYEVTELYENGSNVSDEYIDAAVAQAADHDVIIFASYNATNNESQKEMVAALAATGKPVVVVGVRNPYDANAFPEAAAVLNTYGWQVQQFQAAVDAITATFNPSGKLPVTIMSVDGNEVLYPLGHGLSYGEDPIDPTPEPTPEPTPDPTPEPTPDPTPEPTPDPTQGPGKPTRPRPGLPSTGAEL